MNEQSESAEPITEKTVKQLMREGIDSIPDDLGPEAALDWLRVRVTLLWAGQEMDAGRGGPDISQEEMEEEFGRWRQELSSGQDLRGKTLQRSTGT